MIYIYLPGDLQSFHSTATNLRLAKINSMNVQGCFSNPKYERVEGGEVTDFKMFVPSGDIMFLDGDKCQDCEEMKGIT